MVVFNRLLLVACLSIVIALILYFFYWNRFLAWVIGQTIRFLLWKQEGSSLWIEIGSIHFSLIAGRILLKDIRYHSSNQTIKLVTAQIQWRYWIRQPTVQEDISVTSGENGNKRDSLWNCRIQLSFQGLEWFLYNRTAAYDSIVEQMEKANRPISRSSSRKTARKLSRQDTGHSQAPSGLRSVIRVPLFMNNAMAWFRARLPNLDPKELFPLGINVQMGAIVLGNSSTPSLLVAEFRSALGTYGITTSKSTLDLYKQVLDLKFQNAVVQLLQNQNYVDPMPTLGALVHARVKQHPTLQKPTVYQSYRTFDKLWRQFGLYRIVLDYFTNRRSQRTAQRFVNDSVFPKQTKKSVDEETPIGLDYSGIDYAVERKIMETPSLELRYYVDVVGETPLEPSNGSDDQNYNGNSDTPPEWGFDLIIHGGFFRYGPWADRQRAELQKLFFPSTYHNTEVTVPLNPGDKRIWAALQIFIELRGTSTLSIPFREASKDWQWDGLSDVPGRPKKREPAVINLSAGDRSTINYTLPMIVNPTGYEPTLEVHLDTIVISSSLNDIKLIASESLRVRCELPTPVTWNAERVWSIAVFLRQPILFLLRDHINMFTDLARDWVSGPPTDHQKFIPMIYAFRLEMHHFMLNLYANDQNIVDKALIKEENALVSLRGPHWKTTANILSNVFRPESTAVPITTMVPDVVASISLPRWNTHALYLPPEGLIVFRANHLGVNASYEYFSSVHEDHLDQLRIAVDVKDATYTAYGWSIRYFMSLRDNYLGSFTHFQTLAEYLDKRRNNLPTGDPITQKYRAGKANMLQSEVTLHILNAEVWMPLCFIGADNSNRTLQPSELRATSEMKNNFIVMSVPEIQLQLRLHDYYMDMSLNFDCVITAIPSQGNDTRIHHECLVIDGIDIVAHRLFGPQPKTSTYVCIWEIALGSIKGSASAQEISLLAGVGEVFKANYSDRINAPAEEFGAGVELDVTFYKISVKSIEFLWKAGQVALQVQLSDGLRFDSNDLGTHLYRKVSSIRVPKLLFRVLMTISEEHHTWLEAGEIDMDVMLDIYTAPSGYRNLVQNQLAFIEEQDKVTARAKVLFNRLRQHNTINVLPERMTHRGSIYLPQPSLPISRIGQPPSTRRFQPVRHSRPDPRGSWRFSLLANLSDSEGEEGVSEADRDARLARTRTSTPITQPDQGSDSTSSGDESDDADLTDGESTADDWSEAEGSAHGRVHNSLMSFYSPVLRHYTANWRDNVAGWDDSSFTLTKRGASFMNHSPPYSQEFDFDEPLTPPEELPKHIDLTTFRLRSNKGIHITVSPLTLPAVTIFEDNISSFVSTPAMVLDSLLMSGLAQSTKTQISKRTVLDAALSSITAQVILHVPLSLENLQYPLAFITSPSNLDVITVCRITLDGFRLALVAGGEYPIARGAAKRFTATVDMAIDKRTLPPASNPKICDIVLSSISLNSHHHRLAATIDDISVLVRNDAPDIVTSTAFALASAVSTIQQSFSRWKGSRTNKIRAIVGHLLKMSDGNAILDPLSAIQPSYLVQSGTPQSLRMDLTFRFFYHLRNCLWSLAKEDFWMIHNDAPYLELEAIVLMVKSRLASLDADSSDILELKIPKSLFGLRATEEHASNRQNAYSCNLVIGKAVGAILAPPGGSSSQVIVEKLDITLQDKCSDLSQINSTAASSASQSSLRSKSARSVRTVLLTLSASMLNIVVSPHLLQFIQHVLRVRRQSWRSSTKKVTFATTKDGPDRQASNLLHLQVIGGVHQISLRAGAENLVVVLGANAVQTSTSLLLNGRHMSPSLNHSTLFGEIYFQARSPTDIAREGHQDILAAIGFSSGAINVLSGNESSLKKRLKIVVDIDAIQLNVPRSALRLYHFIGQWRADYLPGMEKMLKTLVSEYNAEPKHTRSSVSSTSSAALSDFYIHGQVNRFKISLQVMHGTWLAWEVRKTIAYFQASSTNASSHTFGVQMASMLLSVSSNPDADDSGRGSHVKLAFPEFSLTGHSVGNEVEAMALLDFVDLKVKPSHWDTLLAVQQKFGQDFNDLVSLIEKTRLKGPKTGTTADKQKNVIQYKTHFKLKGFRVALEGVSSTLILECKNVYGSFVNSKQSTWDVDLSGLSLSFGPRMRGLHNTQLYQGQRSAFVLLNFKLSGVGSEPTAEKKIQLQITKVHAVMQPSSIGELGDFLDNLQVEMLSRQEQRASELAAFKEKTEHILRTFDASIKESRSEKVPWINELTIAVSINNVGVAFPLIHDGESKKVRDGSNSVRAFLFAIRSINFQTHRGETGEADMQYLSFQFVSGFRQNIEADFTPENYSTRNWLLYPQMKAQLRSSNSGTSRKVWIKGDVSGFILDIDSSIPGYIFALIDVYRTGRERVERLSTAVPRTPMTAVPPPVSTQKPTMPTSNIFLQLVFHSGKIRLYSGSANSLFKARYFSGSFDVSDDQVLDVGAEVFNLPVVSVWGEYRASLAPNGSTMHTVPEPSTLIFNTAVYSSQNTLRPSLLSFATELVAQVERRMRKVSSRIPKPPPLASVPSTLSVISSRDENQSDVTSTIQICFSLRIDKSKLELTCQPDVNVIAGLHWESGGFVVKVSPGARKISFFGSVGGLTIGLKHGFLSEDCVKVDARNLTFSVTFSKMESQSGQSLNLISVVLDTEFLGVVRFSRLQDILCFKAVWLDRIPVLNNEALPPRTPFLDSFDTLQSEPLSKSSGFITAVLLRVRKVALEVELGQSITKIGLELHESTFRTTLSDELKEVFFHIANVDISAQGNLTGRATVSSCVFQTVRRSENMLLVDDERSRMLELKLTSGALTVVLDSDHQRLLHYRAEPLMVEIFDDWSSAPPNVDVVSEPLQLSFNVDCPEIIAVATVSTIPKLLSYINKFKANLDGQRQGAARESQTFRISRTPKPDNPLSAVAEAMLQSARSRFKEAESGLEYVVNQHISLRLDLLRLIVFPRTMRDTEIAQFIGRDVRARLSGVVGTESAPLKKDLHLSFSSMVISRFTQIPHATLVPLNSLEHHEDRSWLADLFKDGAEATVFGLPSMRMHMTGEEIMEDTVRTLVYDFHSEFIRRAGMKAFEDIYITLNMSLYSWLTVLRKNLTRELDQVRATEDWRTSVNNLPVVVAPSGGPGRKKRVPEPLALTDSPRSATLPSTISSPQLLSPTRTPYSARPVQGKTPRETPLSPLAQAVLSPSSSRMVTPSASQDESSIMQDQGKSSSITYKPRNRHIERLTMRQLGEATPDVMHPFFMKKAGFNLEDSLPQYVNEYAATPLQEILEILLKLYSQQLLNTKKTIPSE